jgi:hypothetical protein
VTGVRRIFTDEKTVESPTLNRLGAQPFRAVLARLLYKLRSGNRDPLNVELSRTGLIVCEDFLPPTLFDAIEREADEFMTLTDPTWLIYSGTTEGRRHSLAQVDPERFPELARWRTDWRLATLAAGAERRRYPISFDGGALVEQLTLGDYSEPDEETQLHVDTYFNTHKLWLYLDAVTAANGAFVYVPGSHLLDRVRLGYEYRESTTLNRKSRRVGDDEIRDRGLKLRVVECRRNTLVVANTCGYHGRSLGESGATRRALHREYRLDPFKAEKWNPLQVKRTIMDGAAARKDRTPTSVLSQAR